MNLAMLRDFEPWAESARAAFGSRLSSMPFEIRAVHLWHGDRSSRQYTTRHDILYNGFDPKMDVVLNDQGVLSWTAHANVGMVQRVYDMFRIRNA